MQRQIGIHLAPKCRKKFFGRVLISVIAVCIGAASPCYASENETAALEGEGTLSPPSENSKESVFGGTASNETVTDEKMMQLLGQIQSSLPANNGRWSVFVGDLLEESEGAVNEQRMQAASLIKLYIMGAVYENYDLLTQQYGKENVDTNLHSMITVSDNDAANTLVNYLGGGDSSSGMQVVNDFCTKEGYTSTHMGRMLLESNEYDDNYTSVSDCGHFLTEIYWEDDYTYAEEMLELLADQERRNKIPAQIPDGVSVANKTGELSDVENDAGIIYNAENDLILVFMSENLTDTGNAQNTIATVSRQIYDYYNG